MRTRIGKRDTLKTGCGGVATPRWQAVWCSAKSSAKRGVSRGFQGTARRDSSVTY